MFKNKKTIETLVFFLLLGFLGINVNAAVTKKKKTSSKTKTPSAACLSCLNAFSPETLTFTMTPEQCIKIVSNCDKTNRTARCESAIQECIQYNCTNTGSCSDEIANRALFYGCLKAENQFLPYQCASYISGYASSKASEVKAELEAQQQANERAIAQQEAAIKQAEAAAQKAAADAKVKAAEAEANAKAKQAQIEQETELKKQQQQYELEQQKALYNLELQAKQEAEKRNSKPNVKYNNLLSQVKKDISTAKTYSSKAYNLLGIKKTTDNQSQENALFFPPQIITMDAIYASNDPKTLSLVNGSKYKTSQNFVCTKDTKESYIKNELNNIYNTLKKSRDNLSTGISELETLNADDETLNKIDEAKITTLYQAQNKLTEVMQTTETYMNELTTSCETRCEGFAGISSGSTSSGILKYDEDGNIIDDKPSSDNSEYTCKDFDEESNSNDIIALISGSSTSMTDLVGGIGKKVSDLTKRVTRAVLEVDKLLDETEIAVQSGKYDTNNLEYPAIDSCIQYMVLDIAQYTQCVANVLGQQLLALSKNKNSPQIQSELNSSISKILINLQSPNYKNVHNETIYCTAGSSTGSSISGFTFNNLSSFDDFQTCVLSITNAINIASKNKKETGEKNFNVSYYDENNVLVNNSSIMNPTEFMKTYVKWDLATSCKIKTQIITQQTYFGTNQSTDYNNSMIECSCSNGKTSVASFQNLNNGSYDKTACSSEGNGKK